MVEPHKNKGTWHRVREWLKRGDSKESEFRYEKKFLIPLQELHAFEIRLSRMACSPIHLPRWINNLYCDTPEYEHLNENIEGLSERKKLRLRWYGDKHGTLKVTAEFKIKLDDTNTKNSVKLGKIKFPQEMDLNTLFQICMLQWGNDSSNAIPPANYTPTLLNRYYRSYYLNSAENIRITVDTPIYYENAVTGIRAEQSEYAIVELKCPANQIITSDLLPYQLSKSSKYIEGLQLTDPQYERSSI